MKTYLINVNGVSYEVEVEEVGGSAPQVTTSAPIQAAAAPQPKVAPKVAAPTPVAKPVAVPSGNGEIIKAPIPGTILDVKVQVGMVVKPGDLILILEAMKMENEIMAAKAGTVKAIFVVKGQSVNSGDALIEMQ
jgi:glutaconyl-CoA decarboxylase